MELSSKAETLHIEDLANQKTVLFLSASPVNTDIQSYINIIYSLLFKGLFEIADANEYHLPIPIYFICDDFAVGAKVPKFEQYISIFREFGISVTILLQSETHLADMYGEGAGKTILNNCDTVVYTGGMDIKTIHNMSMRTNFPYDDILTLPAGQVIVCRRGEKPVFDKRYPTKEDPRWIEMEEDYQKKKKKEDLELYFD